MIKQNKKFENFLYMKISFFFLQNNDEIKNLENHLIIKRFYNIKKFLKK